MRGRPLVPIATWKERGGGEAERKLASGVLRKKPPQRSVTTLVAAIAVLAHHGW